MADTDTYRVTRRPDAPPRRAGRVWPAGTTEAELTAAQAAVIGQDSGYVVDAKYGAIPRDDAPADTAAPRRNRAKAGA